MAPITAVRVFDICSYLEDPKASSAYYSEGIGMPTTGRRDGPEGGTALFRELLRESADGWRPTFPGSDHLAMIRRKQATTQQ
jgi:hypothetical protein